MFQAKNNFEIFIQNYQKYLKIDFWKRISLYMKILSGRCENFFVHTFENQIKCWIYNLNLSFRKNYEEVKWRFNI